MRDDEVREIEQRLENWRRVVMGGSGGAPVTCGSAEAMYRGDRDEDRRKPTAAPDVLDAWKVEQAWKSLPFPRHRWLLKFHYLKRWPQHRVIQGLMYHTGVAVKRWHYRAEVFYALGQLKRVLDMQYRTLQTTHPQLEQNFLVHNERSRRDDQATFARLKEPKPAEV